MLDKQEYLELHSKFYDYLTSEAFPSERFLSYDLQSLPTEIAQGPEWLIFALQAKEYINVIKNEINQFMTLLLRLNAWSKVLDACSEDARFDLNVEVITPLASYAINYVYAIKGRIAFITGMLLHQTLRLVDPAWNDADLKQAKFYTSNLYGLLKKYENLIGQKELCHDMRQAIDRIDDEDFRKATDEYRGKFNHMVPPNIEFGLSSLMTRFEEETGDVHYGFGGHQPISLKSMLAKLDEQQELCLAAFNIFWQLMENMLDLWKNERPISPPLIGGKDKHN